MRVLVAKGARFTGLTPAGRDRGPAIPAADEAVRVGSVEPGSAIARGRHAARLREEFSQLIAARTLKAHDLAAGRRYIKAYIEFIHFVERLYDSTMQALHGHFDERESPSKNQLPVP